MGVIRGSGVSIQGVVRGNVVYFIYVLFVTPVIYVGAPGTGQHVNVLLGHIKCVATH